MASSQPPAKADELPHLPSNSQAQQVSNQDASPHSRPSFGQALPSMGGDSCPESDNDSAGADGAKKTDVAMPVEKKDSERSSAHNSAVAIAAQAGDLLELKALMGMRSEDQTQSDGGEALHKFGGYLMLGACRGGHTQVLQWLSDNRMDASLFGGVPIRAACGGGHLETLLWLKEHRVEPTLGGPAALTQAAASGNTAVLDFLENEGFIIKESILHIVKSPDIKSLDWLEKKIGIEELKKHGPEASKAAVASGSIDACRWLVDKRMMKKESSFLTIAALHDRIEVLEWLLKKQLVDFDDRRDALKKADALGHVRISNFIKAHCGEEQRSFCWPLKFLQAPGQRYEPKAMTAKVITPPETGVTADNQANCAPAPQPAATTAAH